MKFFLITVLVLQFLSAEAFAQNKLKDKLKQFEDNGFLLAPETHKKKSGTANFFNDPDIGIYLDSLILYVASQKENREATFDKNINPYLDLKMAQWNSRPVNFSNDEEMIFESFLKRLKWKNTTETVQLYENFISESYKDVLQLKSILTVFSSLRYLHMYVASPSDVQMNQFIKTKLNDEFQSYNTVNWNVFAKHPDAMVFWLTATWIWDYGREN